MGQPLSQFFKGMNRIKLGWRVASGPCWVQQRDQEREQQTAASVAKDLTKAIEAARLGEVSQSSNWAMV
jgi:hypothetical protein